MCSTPEELREKAKWDGALGHSRQHLLSEIQSEPFFFCYLVEKLLTTVCLRVCATDVHDPRKQTGNLADTGAGLSKKQLRLPQCPAVRTLTVRRPPLRQVCSSPRHHFFARTATFRRKIPFFLLSGIKYLGKHW